MDHITEADLRNLMSVATAPCVSIYIPTQRKAGLNADEDSLRLKNLLNDAKAGLIAFGYDPEKADRLLGPPYELLSDQLFWKQRGDGLAVFISTTSMQTYRLPISFTEAVRAGEKFYISPLLELFSGDKKFYIFAVSQDSTRLLKADRTTAQVIDVPGMPSSSQEANWFKETDKSQQIRNIAAEAGSYHGEGDDTRQPNADEREYLLKVDTAMSKILQNEPEPLVLIGLSPLLGIFTSISKYKKIVGEIHHDPTRASDQELHGLAWPLVEPLARKPLEAAKNAYASYEANEPRRAESDPELICVAAEEGRVDTLMVARPKPGRRTVVFGERIEFEDTGDTPIPTEHLERATQATISNRGQVMLVSADEMPSQTDMAAILRY